MPRPLDLPDEWRKFAATEQGYRFHGQNPPKRVVNELPAGPVRDGIATLRLYDPIDSWGGEWGVSAKEFTAALDGLGSDIHTIQLHINSPGGEVFDGIAILNALRNHPAKVVGVVDGIAASAASFIAAGCDELVMGKNSELMIHDARGICIGNAADMAEMQNLLGHLSDNIAGVYAEKTGGSVADWRARMLGEAWFSAEEAVTVGLADRIEGDAQPTNRHDLSQFAHSGRASAPAPNLEQPKNLDPHAYSDPDGDGVCEICGTPESEHDDVSSMSKRTAETARLRHRMRARELGLPA